MPIVVFATILQKLAKALTKILLKNRACACVNILKRVESLFWWQGKIDQVKEALLVIKTKDSSFFKLKKLIESNHPYTVPEIIAFKIDKINKAYYDWLNKEVND